ncbi:MAG: hypothetical protein ACI37Q_04185 [Candidatus Gastranaerophilaceae bacterium]
MALGFENSRTKNNDDASVTTSNNATLSNNTEHITSASFTNKREMTVNNDDGTSSNIEREIMVAGSINGSSDVNYRIDKTQTVTNEQGEEVEQNKSHEVSTHYNREEKSLDLHYSQSRSENGELQSRLDIDGMFTEDGGEASVRTSKLNKHGRMVRTEVAANASDEAQHLGLKFKRNINNTPSTRVEEGAKPKKSKSLYIKADVTKTQIESEGNDYNEFFDDYSQDYSDEEFYDEDNYEGYDNEDDLSQDYDYSDGVGSQPKAKTDVDVKTRYRVGNDAVSVESHNLEGGRVGYSHSFHNKDNGTSGSASAYTQYDKENGLNIGVGASRVKRDENGSLKNATAASVSVNPQNGDITATTGYAAPIRDKNKEQVGNMSTYAQYNSKAKSVTVGGQINRIVYKKPQDNEQSKINNTDEDDFFNSETDIQENTQDAEEMEAIGNNEVADSYTVEDDLNNVSQISDEKQVAGGYHIRAEVGHASDRNPALQYNIDAQGFINTNIAGKNSTVYGRVTSTNGHLDEVNNVYGGQLNNPMQSDIRDVASGHENMEKYRETSFREHEGSEVNNVTTVGMGAVIGNPEQLGTNFAGSANAAFEDGKMTNFTAIGRGEYVFNAGDNRQAFGAEAAYNIDKNFGTRSFVTDAYYDHTFNNGKTRINTGIGYAQNSFGESGTQTVFTSFGARQQVAKNVDVYGQFEFGQTKGIGSMDNSNDTYMATRIGAQYHLNKNTVVFGEYNVGHGSAMSQSRMIPQADKDRMKAGNITFGIGMRF